MMEHIAKCNAREGIRTPMARRPGDFKDSIAGGRAGRSLPASFRIAPSIARRSRVCSALDGALANSQSLQ